MRRGIPRPMTKVGKLNTYMLTDEVKQKWENRSYPHPYSAQEEDIATLHNGRVGHCITQGMCIVCGDHVVPDEDGKVWIYRNPGTKLIIEDSGPFHEKCMRMTIAMCPVVHERSKGGLAYVWSQAVWKDIAPLIRGKHNFMHS